MSGLGNDFICADVTKNDLPETPSEAAVRLCRRDSGVDAPEGGRRGADGLILIGRAKDGADFSMRIFNADGSEAAMCGNGIRCVAKFILDNGLSDKRNLSIETLSGIRKVSTLGEANMPDCEVKVDMGKADASAFGEGWLVKVGNPHYIRFKSHFPESNKIVSEGEALQQSKDFPDGINVEWAVVENPRKIRMKVFERGCGMTLACGTGACATAAAAFSAGLAESPVNVVMDGGSLEVSAEGGNIIMKGRAETEINDLEIWK